MNHEQFFGIEGLPGVGKTTLIWSLFDPDTKPRDYLPNGVGKHIAVVGESRDFCNIPIPQALHRPFQDRAETKQWNEYFLEVERIRKIVAEENAKSGLPVIFDRTAYSILFFRRALQLFDPCLYSEFQNVVELFSAALENNEIILPHRMILVTAKRDLILKRLQNRGVTTSIFANELFLKYLEEYYDIFSEICNESSSSTLKLESQQSKSSLEQMRNHVISFTNNPCGYIGCAISRWKNVISQIEK